MRKLKKVRLYGVLRSKFGKDFCFHISNASEAIRALSTQLPGFQKFLIEAKNKGLNFVVLRGKTELGLEELDNPVGDEVIRIAPVIEGAKNKFFKIIGGIALAAVGFMTGGLAGALLLSVGGSLALGGVMQLISPQQKGLGMEEPGDQARSHTFTGAPNLVATGQCVPLAYGDVFVSPFVISSGIWSEVKDV